MGGKEKRVMEGIVFSDLEKIVKNPEAVSERPDNDRWYIMPYETAKISGNALMSTYSGAPKDVVLSPNLSGWHKIFVSSIRMVGDFWLLMKLDNEEHFMTIHDSYVTAEESHSTNETVEEQFWCCADLTGRDIVLRKHKSNIDSISTLVWLRCVPMTEEEIAEYKDYVNADGRRNLHVHYDNDSNDLHGTDKMEDLLMLNYTVKDTDAKICTQEILDDVFEEDAYDETDRVLQQRWPHYNDQCRRAAAKMDEIVKTRADLMHSMGVKLYAGYRASVSLMSPPFVPLLFSTFVKKNPEFSCYTRDGRRTGILSFAYPEVRRYAIDYLKRAVARGYDGVSLICHRGIRFGFEQPVCDEFARRHGGIDARRVPMNDDRLLDIWCEFFTQFVCDLHRELDEQQGRHVPINVITGYTPEASRRMGVDVEALCKAGVIDHFCAEAMDIYEAHLGSCMGEDGLIDMEKYRQVLCKTIVVGRRFGESWDLVKDGTPKFLEISKKYGVEFFAGMSPNNMIPPLRRIEWIQKLRELGAENFSFFNFCHDGCRIRPIVYAAAKTGHEKNYPEYYTPNFYRILSLGGVDISTYNASVSRT